MFEKDIYQLIRSMRAHKGDEREYIQACLRECRKEVRGQDMDQKATALLKLIYLEMFGHDMSWASFNVLEVMSSQKYLQKRVGYLAAVQTFRPDTEVLMLAENLLKKDLSSPDKVTMALPLVAIPHVVSPSMANSLLTDLLPRLSHSTPTIRKKTIVTLYRLALVYPESLRAAWPKIKERLLDEDEDPSVTAAVVNVVCELGWRRPQDFLPLAPRLFELLTAGGNNWMAIKIIKLFSTLTPLEPRLVRKLLPPLTSIIKNTPAMSLLYECINGIIQGGIMDAAEGTTEGDEVARLCVNKLRAMLVVEGDPNLRYVALLALAKITSSHADLVSQHQDVILECIDDGDISIRTRALDLIAGMVNANNLPTIVERLLIQLRGPALHSTAEDPVYDRVAYDGVVPMADDDDNDPQETIRPKARNVSKAPPLPDDYRVLVIERILEMCSKDTYASMNDFDWYIAVLAELVKYCPASTILAGFANPNKGQPSTADAIGAELLNVAVRVKAVRSEAAAAAQTLLTTYQSGEATSATTSSRQGVLSSAAFIAGEYASLLPDPEAALTSLLQLSNAQLSARVLMSYLQAITKIFARLTSDEAPSWTETRQSHTTLIVARITHFLDKLVLHPSLEVQERAVGYLDLMRLAGEAAAQHDTGKSDDSYVEPPLLLTQAIPSLFTGMELNPVAHSALRNVQQPEDIDLDVPINSNLHFILQQAEYDSENATIDDQMTKFYYEKPSVAPTVRARAAADLLPDRDPAGRSSAYQDVETTELRANPAERKKASRRERHRDDPYYIDSEHDSGTSTPMHNILRAANGEELDVDAIPVMELKLDSRGTASDPERSRSKITRKPKRHFEITGDETLGGFDAVTANPSILQKSNASRSKKSLLEVDSSVLSSLSLTEGGSGRGQLDYERRQVEEEEMAKAVREVERLRLEMQRAQEQIELRGASAEGIVVKRKKKKKTSAEVSTTVDQPEPAASAGDTAAAKPKRKKKKKRTESVPNEDSAGVVDNAVALEEPVKPKKKKKREVTFDGE